MCQSGSQGLSSKCLPLWSPGLPRLWPWAPGGWAHVAACIQSSVQGSWASARPVPVPSESTSDFVGSGYGRRYSREQSLLRPPCLAAMPVGVTPHVTVTPVALVCVITSLARPLHSHSDHPQAASLRPPLPRLAVPAARGNLGSPYLKKEEQETQDISGTCLVSPPCSSPRAPAGTQHSRGMAGGTGGR